MSSVLPAIALLFMAIQTLAQAPLSYSRQSGLYTYVYKIGPEEALKLYRSRMDKVGEQYLNQLVDSFQTIEPSLPAGNYLYVHARGTKLQFELKTVGDLQYKLVDNDDALQLSLHDK